MNNSKSRALNLVTRHHASKMVKGELQSDCDCEYHSRYGLIKVGPKCADSRIAFLQKEVMRPGHTHKTGGKNSERRLNRSRLRGYMWSAENDSARNAAERDYEDSLSPEYKAQREGHPYSYRKKASGESATKLGLAA